MGSREYEQNADDLSGFNVENKADAHTLAMRDMNSALDLYRNNDSSDPDTKLKQALSLATAQLDLGIDATGIISEYHERIEDIPDEYQQLWFKSQETQLLMRTGLVDEALLLADQIAASEEGWAYNFHTYNSLGELAEDDEISQELFTKAHNTITGRNDTTKLGILAVAKHEKGFETDSLFQEAREKLHIDKGVKDYWIGGLAENYAKVGRFDEATELIPLIGESHPKDKNKHQLEVTRGIARKQIDAGFIDEGIQTAELTHDEYSKALIAVYALKERVNLDGDNAEEIIDNTISIVHHFSRNPNALDYDGLKKAKYKDVSSAYLYADIGEVAVKQDSKYRNLFDTALDYALLISDDRKVEYANALKDIANSQYKAGLDPRPVFDQALSVADTIKSEHWLEEFDQDFAYEDIAEAAVDAEYYEIVEQVFERWDNKNEEINFDYYTEDKIKLLTHRAKARLGHSPDKA